MLYLLFVLCGTLTVAFLYQERKERYIFAVILKGLASLCFVAVGILSHSETLAAKMIVCGLMISAVADILHGLRKVFKEKSQEFFLAGTLLFLAGHILCLAAIFPLSVYRLVSVVAGVILTALLTAWLFKQITIKPVQKVLCTVYFGAILLVNTVVIGNLITHPSSFTGLFSAGAMLYLISDILLILNTFGAEFKQSIRTASICLYYSGQLLIALSLNML